MTKILDKWGTICYRNAFLQHLQSISFSVSRWNTPPHTHPGKHTQLLEPSTSFSLHLGIGCDLTPKTFPLLISFLPAFPSGAKPSLSEEGKDMKLYLLKYQCLDSFLFKYGFLKEKKKIKTQTQTKTSSKILSLKERVKCSGLILCILIFLQGFQAHYKSMKINLVAAIVTICQHIYIWKIFHWCTLF